MRPRRANVLRVLAVLLFVWSPSDAWGHEGHDHGAPPPPVSKTIAPRAEASSDDFEVVLVARADTLTIHLDAFRTNEPIEGAKLEIDSPAGILIPQPSGKEDGSYVVAAPFLTEPGKYDLAITISARDTVDILAATLVIPQEPAIRQAAPLAFWPGAPEFARNLKRRLADTAEVTWLALLIGFISGMVACRVLWPRILKPSALLLATLGVAALAGGTAQAAEVQVDGGRDVAQRFPDGAVFVPKPTQRLLSIRTIFAEEREHRRVVELPGRVIPDPNSSGLVQTSVGGRLFPPEGGFKPLGTRVKAGDILAYVRPPLPLADSTAQAQQARELDQQIAILARRVERLRTIREIIAKSQLEDAELELKGLMTRRSNLDRARSEPESLVAPVDGVLAAANAAIGQMAEPNSVIFQIIDPDRLWVEALSYSAIPVTASARGLLPHGQTLDLAHVGTGFADRNQAIPIHFSITKSQPGLRIGQFLTVFAGTAETRKGVAIPSEAVIRASNGQWLVYEHTNAERFVPREVRVEPLDGANVLILAGIEPKRRIVTQGAELLSRIR